MSEQADNSSYIQSIQRAAAIMRCFTESEPELSVMEISRRLDLHKSTVSRMLATLQHEGLVEQNPESGKYRLGLGLISLAGVALGRLNARAAAQPYLTELVEATQETVNVTVLDGRECVNIERAFSPPTHSLHGLDWPPHASLLHRQRQSIACFNVSGRTPGAITNQAGNLHRKNNYLLFSLRAISGAGLPGWLCACS